MPTTENNGLALNAFDKIPAELIQEFFDWCFESKDISYVVSELVDCGQAMTMKLSQVCQRWRSITFSMPHLWAYIRPGNPEMVKLWLQRSGSVPIYIGRSADKSDPDVARSFSLIAEHAARWIALEFDNHGFSLSELVKFLDADNYHIEQIDILNSLRLGERFPFAEAVFRFISLSPRLREIRFTSFSLPSVMDADIWGRLTMISLKVSCPRLSSLNDVIRCLSLCISATDITFTTPNHLSDPDISSQITVLPRLSSLAVHFPGNVGRFLQYFSFPKLKKLSISNTGSFDGDAFTRYYAQSKRLPNTLNIVLENDLHNSGVQELLRVPWVADVGVVTIHLNPEIAAEARLSLLHDSNVSSKVKEKLGLDGNIIGWRYKPLK